MRISVIIIVLISFNVKAQMFDAELLNHETNIVVKNEKLTKIIKNTIKINNRNGEKYARVRINHSESNNISNLKAYIKDSKGETIKKLKKSDVETRSAISDFSFYEDDYISEFKLRHNTYPFTIYYEYKIEYDEFLYVDYWLPLINYNIPTRNATLNIEVPIDYNVRYKSNLVEKFTLNQIEDNSKIVYTWNVVDFKGAPSEQFAPNIIEFLPHVKVIPGRFNFISEGSFESWMKYGKWEYNILKDLQELPQFEKDKVKSIINEEEVEIEKIRKLYNYLQDETRYVNISIETGGMKPYPASYVAKNKFGDCKALTIYLKSMLKFIGIESFYTSIHADKVIKKIDIETPSQQFNHVILYVPLDKDTLWLDCTSKGPFNYVGTFIQNREAFITDKDSSYFVRTPRFVNEDVKELRKVEMSFNHINNNAIIKVKKKIRGEIYEDLSYINKNISEPRKTKIIRKNYISKEFDLDKFEIREFHRDDPRIELSFEARSDKVYTNYGNEILINILPFSIPQFEYPRERKLPLQFNYPIYKSDSLVYEIPEEYTMTNTLNNCDIINKYGQFSFRLKKEESKIVILKSIIINEGNYTIDDYSSFYDFIQEILSIEKKLYILTTKK